MRSAGRLMLLVVLGGGLFALGWLAGARWGGPGDAQPGRRLEATIFLPLDDNQQRPFPAQEWDAAISALVREFNGATLGPPQEGCFLNQKGELQRERVRPVIVSFKPGELERFRMVADGVGRRLGQEALYVRFEQPRVDLRKLDGKSSANPP
jgi:hypothetical protein